jgi:opacity protein-like surface antigen
MKTSRFSLAIAALAMPWFALPSQAGEPTFLGPAIAAGFTRINSQVEAQTSSSVRKQLQALGNSSMPSGLKGNSTLPMIDLSYGVPLGDSWVALMGFSYVQGKNRFESKTMTNGPSGTVTLNTRLKNQMSVYLAPGARIGDQWLLYAKASYHQARADYAPTPNGALATEFKQASYSARHKGVGYGIGAAFAANEHLEARLELEQVKYRTAANKYVSMTPKTTRANLMLGYRF